MSCKKCKCKDESFRAKTKEELALMFERKAEERGIVIVRDDSHAKTPTNQPSNVQNRHSKRESEEE